MNQNFGDRWPELATDRGRCRAPDNSVIALHCSGADGSQWRKLVAVLGGQFEVVAPNLIGTRDAGPWHGHHAFTLMDEAKAVVDLIDGLTEPVHLIGHSYGGGVALKVATERPTRIVSLTLYEPSAFHILRHVGQTARADLREIECLAAMIGAGLVSGAYQQAAAAFIDYWNGPDAWVSLRPDVRNALIAWLPKATLDFRALIDDDTPLTMLARITCPVLLLRGEHALAPSRRIVEELRHLVPNGLAEIVAGAGHMGPFTHQAEVNASIAAHIRSTAKDRTRPKPVRAIAA
jgi:pimeloyl-ACP methyl ester carboxylesterase